MTRSLRNIAAFHPVVESQRHLLELLEREFEVDAVNLHALIAPSAGPCCYEVSLEMAQAFAARLGFSIEGRRLDLWDANVRQLTEGGVPARQIHVEGICTICDGRFHSHRRSGDGQRNLAVLRI